MIPQVAHDDSMAEWVGSRIQHVGANNFGPCFGLSVKRGNRLLAGVVYHDYQPDNRTIQLSMAADSPMWAHRLTIGVLLSVPFEQLGVFKVWTATPHENIKALRVNINIGFTHDAVLEHHFGPGKHAVICKFLKPNYDHMYRKDHGQESITAGRA